MYSCMDFCCILASCHATVCGLLSKGAMSVD